MSGNWIGISAEECINEDGYLVKLSTGRKVLLDIKGEVEIYLDEDNCYSSSKAWNCSVEIYEPYEGYSDEEQCIDDDCKNITSEVTEEELKECMDRAERILISEAEGVYDKNDFVVNTPCFD